MEARLDPAICERLRASTLERVTSDSADRDFELFDALLAVYAIVLARYAGKDHVAIGTPRSVELDLSGDPPFIELARRAHDAVAASDTAEGPAVAEAMILSRPANELELYFDVLLELDEQPTGLRLTWRYDTELFAQDTVERMLEHLRTLAASAAASPETRISELSMLSDTERETVVRTFNQHPGAPQPEHECVKDIFEEQVRLRHDAPAVAFGSATLTYAQLNSRANQVAWMLREHGVGPGTFVGVLMDKSIDLLPAVLGVIKAGGAYIPLDPNYPAERIEFMVADAKPLILLTQAQHMDLELEHDGPRFAVDQPGALDAYPLEDLPTIATGDDLAYVIYTSGSTGKPKGVMIANRNLAHGYYAWNHVYDLLELRAFAQTVSFSFDVFTLDMSRALLSGAKLVLCPRDTVIQPAALYELMTQEGIDTANLVPASAQVLCEWAESKGKRLDFLRFLTIGGEAWRGEQYAFYKGLMAPAARLVNCYGPTEATIENTWFEPAEGEELQPGRIVPIGRPHANSRIYVLDGQMQPQPIGIPGELCIGGMAVGRGYLNRPELTAERFVPDPFSDDPGARMYRTGDLARWRPDGTIDFLGRTDRQIKIRGFRIEPGEIESALERVPGVRKAAVIDRPGAHGQTQLVAYIEPAGQAPEIGEIRAALAQRLPEHMVPSAYVTLDELPLTPNGKIDRGMLPEPDESAFARSGSREEPATELEHELVPIWERLLGVNGIGVDEDFFKLGGHSLLAVQVVQAIEQELHRKCTLAMLFRNGTIRALAEELHAGGGDATEATILQLAPGTGPGVFCLLGVHAYQDLAEELSPDHPTYGIFLPVEQQLFDAGQRRMLKKVTVEAMAAQYVDLISSDQPSGPYCLLGFCFGGTLALEVAHQLRAVGEDVQLVVMLDNSARAIFKPGMPSWRWRLKHWVKVQADKLPERVQRRLLGEAWMTSTDRLDRMRQLMYEKAEKRYVLRPYDAPVLLIQPEESLAEYAGTDPTWGWGPYLPALTIRPTPGGHVSHLSRPNVHMLAERLREALQQTTTPSDAAV